MSTPSSRPPTSGHWWSLSKSSSKLAKDKLREGTLSRTSSSLHADGHIADQPTKSSSMFGNFTSAIRLKPKKNNHAAAVHEPPKAPSPLIIPPPNSVEPYGPLTSRPYSKAVSAVTITDEDSIEPKTPSDLRLSYQKSLMDADPFAATTGILFSSPKEAQEFDQLFVLPNGHLTKDAPVSPRTTHRRPHTANSQLFRERLVSESTVPSPRPAASRPAVTIRTPPDVLSARSNMRMRKVSMNDVPSPSPVTTRPVTSATPAGHSRSKSKSSDGVRPQTRPRGMTDNTGIRPSLRKDLPSLPLTRRPSIPRSVVTPPDTSPPSRALPPVPSLKFLAALPDSDRSPTEPVSSSSSVSFASSASEHDPTSKGARMEDWRLQSIRDRVNVPSEPGTKSPPRALRGTLSPTLSRRPATADDRPNSLKKMPSQPSLRNKFTSHRPGFTDDHSSAADDLLGSLKPLHKQRSFHHPRVPVPPLPHLRHANSFTPSEASVSQSVDLSRDKEKERQKEKPEITGSLSKRLFLPGSMRRGSSSHIATFTIDDDTGSFIMPPSELDKFDKSPPPRFSNLFGSPGVESMMLPATSTFYDDLAGSPMTPSHPPQPIEAPPPEAGPQQILSAAQLVKLEEMLEHDDPEVCPVSNRASPAELNSLKDPSPVVPPLFEEFGFNRGTPQRKNSWTDSIVSASTVFSTTMSDKVLFPDRVDTGSTLSFFDKQQHPGYRSRTTSGNLHPLESNFSIMRSHSSFPSPQSAISIGIESTFGIEPNRPPGGLSPSPRQRPGVAASLKSTRSADNRGSMIHIQPLSPPPLRRNPTSTSTSSRSTSSRSSPMSSPRPPPTAFKNDPPVKGIMKKPSFLDITDDLETDARLSVQVLTGDDIHQRNISISSIEDSFLDLGRGNNSFDTIRTLSVEGPG